MSTGLFEERIAVSAVSLLAAVVYGVATVRRLGCAEQSAAARYTVAAGALAIAALCSVGTIPPVIAYAVLCLTLVSVFGVDLLKLERARRRRVASLALRPIAGAIPIVWIGTAAVSSFMLTPYVVLDEQRIAALLVAFCTLATAAIAWRIVTAPEQLAGKDLHRGRSCDRTLRGVRSGIAAVLAIGSIMVFISFENAELPAVLPLQRAFFFASQAIWATSALSILFWWTWQVRRIARASFPTDP